jgi:hypothetical protein
MVFFIIICVFKEYVQIAHRFDKTSIYHFVFTSFHVYLARTRLFAFFYFHPKNFTKTTTRAPHNSYIISSYFFRLHTFHNAQLQSTNIYCSFVVEQKKEREKERNELHYIALHTSCFSSCCFSISLNKKYIRNNNNRNNPKHKNNNFPI